MRAGSFSKEKEPARPTPNENMFVDCDLTGAHLALLGAPERTERVAHKYPGATLVQVANPAHLADCAPVSLAVICAAKTDTEARDVWAQAVRDFLPGSLLTFDAEEPATGYGTVFLIGAGPGKAGYMTARALQALAESDVVLIDHLAPTADLAAWAPGAEIIDVGKVPGAHRVPQRQIDRLMIDKAKAGLKVARLKGGDPYVFGRGTEELYVCEREGIPVEVISGVTSSIAVPASAKVPMTLRKVGHMFTVVSGHSPLSDRELDHLAGFVELGGTVSLLMGVRTLPHTVASLLARGVDPAMPLATFENVYREGERVLFSTLDKADTELAGIRPPAITVIGRTVDAGNAPGQEAAARRDALLAQALSEGRDH